MRVIVADDEFFARRAISKMLKEIMPDVEIVLEAETGREIMEVMEQTAADVIFTDIRMPDGDGLEVAEVIQKHCPDTSVAIISGYADFAYASAAIRYGVEDYLTKPVQKEKLRETLERILQNRKARNQAVEERVESRMELEGIRYMNPEEVFAEEKVSDILVATIPDSGIGQDDCWQMLVIQLRERMINWSRERLEEQREYFRQHLERMKVWEYYFYPREEFLILAAPGQKGVTEGAPWSGASPAARPAASRRWGRTGSDYASFPYPEDTCPRTVRNGTVPRLGPPRAVLWRPPYK